MLEKSKMAAKLMICGRSCHVNRTMPPVSPSTCVFLIHRKISTVAACPRIIGRRRFVNGMMLDSSPHTRGAFFHCVSFAAPARSIVLWRSWLRDRIMESGSLGLSCPSGIAQVVQRRHSCRFIGESSSETYQVARLSS